VLLSRRVSCLDAGVEQVGSRICPELGFCHVGVMEEVREMGVKCARF
jgi:hypothetical protein